MVEQEWEWKKGELQVFLVSLRMMLELLLVLTQELQALVCTNWELTAHSVEGLGLTGLSPNGDPGEERGVATTEGEPGVWGREKPWRLGRRGEGEVEVRGAARATTGGGRGGGGGGGLVSASMSGSCRGKLRGSHDTTGAGEGGGGGSVGEAGSTVRGNLAEGQGGI